MTCKPPLWPSFLQGGSFPSSPSEGGPCAILSYTEKSGTVRASPLVKPCLGAAWSNLWCVIASCGYNFFFDQRQNPFSLLRGVALLWVFTLAVNSRSSTFIQIPCFCLFFSLCVCVLSHFSHAQLSVTPWTVALEAISVNGILQARILGCVTMLSYRGSSQPCLYVSCIGMQVLSLPMSHLGSPSFDFEIL